MRTSASKAPWLAVLEACFNLLKAGCRLVFVVFHAPSSRCLSEEENAGTDVSSIENRGRRSLGEANVASLVLSRHGQVSAYHRAIRAFAARTKRMSCTA